MRKLFVVSALLAGALCVFAQDPKPPKASRASEAYHVYRQAETEPPYGLRKIKATIKQHHLGSEANRALPAKMYNSLSIEEKFTYNMIHGEEFDQNCDVMPALVDEENKIFAEPPPAFFDEQMWSERQTDFLKHNRARVIELLRSTMHTLRRAGTNVKWAILDLKAVELIPDLVNLYNRDQKDNDILSVLMVLMKDGKYAPFLGSTSYQKLYGETASYNSFLVANAANKKLIEDRAMAFYKTRKA